MGVSEFCFFLSCDLNSPVTVRIEKLDGTLPLHKSTDSEEKRPELYVECALYIDGAPFGLPMRIRLNTTGPPYFWNELITLSSNYRDLTAQSQLAITVWDVSCGKVLSLEATYMIVLWGFEWGQERQRKFDEDQRNLLQQQAQAKVKNLRYEDELARKRPQNIVCVVYTMGSLEGENTSWNNKSDKDRERRQLRHLYNLRNRGDPSFSEYKRKKILGRF